MMIQNHKKWLLTMALLATTLILNQSVFAQSQPVGWNLTKGDVLQTTLSQTSVTKTKVDSRETSIVSDNTIVMSWNVTNVDKQGDATMDQAIESVKLSLGDPASPAQTVKYDTAGDNEDITKISKQMLEQVQPLIGLKFEVVMSKLGEIKSVTLPKETSEALSKLPDALNLRNLFTDAGLKDVLGAAAVILPKEKLEANETWTDEKKVNLAFGAFNRKRTYTYLGTQQIDDREFAEFSVKSEMERIADQTNSTKGKLLSFAGSGTLMLDLERGFFSSSQVKNTAATEEAYREKKMNTVVTNEIKMSITKK